MDLRAIDQMFVLKPGEHWVPTLIDSIYVSKKPGLSAEIQEWLNTKKVEYVLTPSGNHALIHIKDPKMAVLFKLSWM